MAIFNSYVSLPEGTSGDILDGKISTPKAKKNLFRRLNKRVVGKKKQISPFCWTSRFQEEHPHFQVNNGDFSIASDFSGWVFSPFLYPVPSRSIPFLHLSHPKMHHLTVFFFGLIIMGCPISEQRHFKHFQNS